MKSLIKTNNLTVLVNRVQDMRKLKTAVLPLQRMVCDAFIWESGAVGS